MDNTERRNMWRNRIERCLASDMTIKEWCHLNRVCKSSLYKWMALFRKEEPGCFPRRSSATTNWIEVRRDDIADACAIVAMHDAHRTSDDQSISDEVESAEEVAAKNPVSEQVDLIGYTPYGPTHSLQSIHALIGCIGLDIPPGCNERDIAAVMRAAMSL